MKRKFLVFGLLLLMGLFVQAHSLKAEDATLTQSVTALEGLQARNVFGVVGRVDYVEFKSKTGSAIVVEDSKGQLVKISLDELARDAKILATFHKVKDKKGNEKNVLISLSIIRPAKEMQKEEKEKKEKVKKQEGKKQEQRKQ